MARLHRTTSTVIILATLALLWPGPTQRAHAAPGYCQTAHNIGNIVFPVTNWGRVGNGNELPYVDCYTGLRIPNCQFPKGSRTIYLFKGGLWVGGVLGRDTLVSTTAEENSRSREFHPYPGDEGRIVVRTALRPDLGDGQTAVSEQDIIITYSDTITQQIANPSFDQADVRGHKPLGLEVTQRSYAWSYEYAQDFVIFEANIRNVTNKPIENAWVGVYMDHDVHYDRLSLLPSDPDRAGKPVTRGNDDYTGFLFDHPTEYYELCEYRDTVRMAWVADNNGDPVSTGFEVGDVTGVRLLGPQVRSLGMAYNWWVYSPTSFQDYGPQYWWNLRDYGNGLGTPVGDRSKYHMMRNGEIDYDQVFISTISPTGPFVPPSSTAITYIRRGGDNGYVLSIGPFALLPGAVITVPWAYCGGQGLHTSATNYTNNIANRNNPAEYVTNLDFSDLARNAVWASWIYDNPGVDTDGDGYAGPRRICVLDSTLVGGRWVPTVADTTYAEGDGQADYRGAAAPEAPKVWLYPEPFAIRVRFNGEKSENSRDIFSGLLDFEGYRVYLGRDERAQSLSLVESYDRENFDRYIYNPLRRPQPGYEVLGIPLTRQEWRCRYGSGADPCADSTFDPDDYSAEVPFTPPGFPDSVMYFLPHDYNASTFGENTRIKKRFPDQPPPSSLSHPQPDELTDDGYFKYYEYEVLIENLLPTVPYFVAVTAFDFGSPKSGLAPLETDRTNSAIQAYPDTPLRDSPEGKKVYIYPNPYRIDARYRANWYEGWNEPDKADNRVRAIHFEHLPPVCTIRIFSLDGDLIREIPHDKSPSDPTASHDKWDLITRNTQLAVTGIYYWTVEEPNGNVQMGKLVIMM